MATSTRASDLSRIRRLAALSGTVLLVAAAVWLATAAVAATTHTVAMDGTRFSPDTITGKRG